MRNASRVGITVLAAIAIVAGVATEAQAAKSPRVLIIGIDGCMPDGVKAAKAPNLKALAANGTVTWDGFSGGVLGTPSRMNTKSLPCWNSILIGVWGGDKHGAVSYKKMRPNHEKYPCFFKRVKDANPNAKCSSIVTWKEINIDYGMVPEADFKANGKNDEETAALAVQHLQETDPTAVFVQLDEVDGAGEGNGFSPESPKYIEAIEKADALVGKLVEAVKKRKTYADEDWLFISVTDHGGTYNQQPDGSHRGGHGGDTPQERKIFIIVSGDSAKKGEVSPGPGIVAVAPTAMRHLGVEIKPEWALDAEPFGLK